MIKPGHVVVKFYRAVATDWPMVPNAHNDDLSEHHGNGRSQRRPENVQNDHGTDKATLAQPVAVP